MRQNTLVIGGKRPAVKARNSRIRGSISNEHPTGRRVFRRRTFGTSWTSRTSRTSWNSLGFPDFPDFPDFPGMHRERYGTTRRLNREVGEPPLRLAYRG